MNIYSVLDDSDEENVAQKKPTTKAPAGDKKKGGAVTAAPSTGKGKAEPKSGKGENSAPSNTAPAAKGKENSRSQKPPASAGEVDDRDAVGAAKDNNRGGKPRGKEPHRRGERRANGEGDDAGHRRPKREFDRRSGTGRGREVAKGGRGSFGAGNVNQDAMDAEKHPGEAEVLLEPKGEEVAGATDDAAEEEAEPAEPEPVTYTLDEFMEKRNEARKEALRLLGGGDKKTARSATADSDFAGMKSVEGGDIDNYMPARTLKSAEVARKDQRSTSKAKVLDVGFRFESNSFGDRDRERGDRGGRGGEGRGGGRGARGGEGRGSGRGGDRGSGRGAGRGAGRGGGGAAAAAATAVFNNAADFPSL